MPHQLKGTGLPAILERVADVIKRLLNAVWQALRRYDWVVLPEQWLRLRCQLVDVFYFG
jgi:hypothetical protein